MKMALETIPVWDGLKSGSECFLCDMMEEAEKDGVRYYLSSAIMTPEVRVETNKHGFCTHHMHLMAEENRLQSLSLVMDTYYGEHKEAFKSFFERIESASNPKKAKKAWDGFFDLYEERVEGCLICSRMKDRLDRYTFTVASLFDQDSEFRDALKESKGFCIHHMKYLVEMAPEALKGDRLIEYYQTLAGLLDKNLDRVQHDDWWQSQKYKSENKDKPWDGCEDAAKRAVYKFSGKSHIIDPLTKKK